VTWDRNRAAAVGSRRLTACFNFLSTNWGWGKGKAIPVTGRGGPWGCETSRFLHFLDNRLRDSSEVVRITLGRPLPSLRFLVLVYIKWLSRPQGHNAVGRITPIEKSNELIGNRTRDLPACSIVPQPTTLPRAGLRTVSHKIHYTCKLKCLIFWKLLSAFAKKIERLFTTCPSILFLVNQTS
jgi:hypothetical protein